MNVLLTLAKRELEKLQHERQQLLVDAGIEEELQRIDNEIRELKAALEGTTPTRRGGPTARVQRPTTQPAPTKTGSYDPDMSWIDKARFMMGIDGPLTVKQILERIYEHEPGLPRAEREHAASLHSTLRYAVRAGTILPVENPRSLGGTLYKLPSKAQLDQTTPHAAQQGA
jgi:hypothetical protein